MARSASSATNTRDVSGLGFITSAIQVAGTSRLSREVAVVRMDWTPRGAEASAELRAARCCPAVASMVMLRRCLFRRSDCSDPALGSSGPRSQAGSALEGCGVEDGDAIDVGGDHGFVTHVANRPGDDLTHGAGRVG